MDAWLEEASVCPPYLYYREFYKPWSGTVQKELLYRGFKIVAQEYEGAFDKSDTMGFDVPAAFVVLDADFDEPVLPFTQHWFWSPGDAKSAIDFHLWFKTVNTSKWPTSAAHEFNAMLFYRRRPAAVFAAVHDLHKIIAEARDFDENPAKKISDRLALLETELRAWTDPNKGATS